jgi:hypothetical protein
VDHPVTALLELEVLGRSRRALHPLRDGANYWHTTTPSVVAGGRTASPT